MSKSQKPFSKMPVEAWQDGRLTLKQLRVLGAILSFADKDGSSCHPKRDALAERCRMLPHNISRATTELVALGWLKKVGGGGYGMPVTYTVTVPDLDTVDQYPDQIPKDEKNSIRIGHKTVSESGTRTVSESGTNRVSDSDTRKEQTIDQTIDQTITRPVTATEKTALVLTAPADAEAPPSDGDVLTEFQSVCRQIWEAYAMAYAVRYGTDPIRNAKVNAQVVQFCKRIPRDEAPHVAASFVANNSAFYVSRGHQFGHLLNDAEKLRTEWATRRVMTTATARQLDATQTNLNSAMQAKEILARRTA